MVASQTKRVFVVAFLVGCFGQQLTSIADSALPGTKRLEMDGDIASQMIGGVDRFLLREIEASVAQRSRHWKRDTSSVEKYNASIEPNRRRLRRIIGAQDLRVPFDGLQYVSSTRQPARVGDAPGYEIYAVRWPVFHGIHGEGLLLEPSRRVPVANVIAIPDADQSPEMLVGLEPGIDPPSQFARRLVESGCRVVVPLLVDRTDRFSLTSTDLVLHRPEIGSKTTLSNREFVYRSAFEMGRHIIGYEVQKVLAAVDWFEREPSSRRRSPRIAVAGYGEGGLIALYSSAVDPRIDATFVTGYFQSRESVWQEPIDRNVFAFLDEFGDAGVASLIAPRPLVIEASRVPELVIEPKTTRGGPGRLATPPALAVEREFQRAKKLVLGLSPAADMSLYLSAGGFGPFAMEGALGAFLRRCDSSARLAPPGSAPRHLRRKFDPASRMRRQVMEMDAYTQYLARESEKTRAVFWSKADYSSHSVERWLETVEPYRQYFYDEIIGRFEHKLLPPNARTVKVFDEPTYVGYKVVLDCFPDVIAYGILLVPKDIAPGERRPTVVCQHGLEGRPRDVADPNVEVHYYKQFACRLAERGFVTYAPQNLYIFEDRFRTLQRKANPIKKTLFSIMVPQHQQLVDWLAGLPFVDPEHIAFYGLSYGGKTAMRVPPLVDRYCLSICSADFNEWIWKNASTRSGYSYVNTIEYEIFEFGLGNTFNYAEMAGLIAPRPFMVERGHHDGVAPDTQVAYEYARVRRLYNELGIKDRTEIEFFDGPHQINGVGTFEFLHKPLKWPRPK